MVWSSSQAANLNRNATKTATVNIFMMATSTARRGFEVSLLKSGWLYYSEVLDILNDGSCFYLSYLTIGKVK